MTTTTDKATHHTYIRDFDGDNENNPAVIVVEIDYRHPEPFDDAFQRVLRAGAKHYNDPELEKPFNDAEAFQDATWNTVHVLHDISAWLEIDFVRADLADADGPLWSGHTNEQGEWCRYSGMRVAYGDVADRCPDQCLNTVQLEGPAKPPALIDIYRVCELLNEQDIHCYTVGVDGGREILLTTHNDDDVVWLDERDGEPGWVMVAARGDGTEVVLWASDHDTTNIIAAAVMAEQHRAMVRAAKHTRER